jgi:DNA-binding transcriptional ArsR family regulator
MVHFEDDLVFRALADPTRRAILEQLDAGPKTVSELAAPFDITLTAVTQHVRSLERAGLVRSTKNGRHRTCTVDHHTLSRAEAWLHDRRQRWETRLDALGHHLDTRSATAPDPREGSPETP